MSTEPAQEELDLDAIRASYEDASPGPWTARSRDCDERESAGLGWEIDGPPEPQLRGQFQRGVDAKLMASSREVIPALVAGLERVRGERDALRREVASTATLMLYGEGETVPSQRYNAMIKSARQLLASLTAPSIPPEGK